MAKTDAVTYAPEGIRVNAVCPGTIMTPLNIEKGHEHPGGLEAYLDGMRAQHPLGAVGDPVDIALGGLYLASDESRSVTGMQMLDAFTTIANGGVTRPPRLLDATIDGRTRSPGVGQLPSVR